MEKILDELICYCYGCFLPRRVKHWLEQKNTCFRLVAKLLLIIVVVFIVVVGIVVIELLWHAIFEESFFVN